MTAHPMKAPFSLAALPVLAVALLLAGCVYNCQQRTAARPEDRELGTRVPDPHAISFHERYRDPGTGDATHATSYIEFDEQGDFWDRR